MKQRSKVLLAIMFIFGLCCTSTFAIDSSNVTFSDFKVMPFYADEDEETYYESFDIYYKSYVYQGYECITEYYLVGYKAGKQEIIMFCCFENNDSQLVATRYDGKGTALLSTNISGYLYYEDRNSFSDNDIEVYGFSDEIFDFPFIVSLLYIPNYEFNGKVGQMVTGDLWPMDYDYKNNILKSWSPE